jgi:hypothetical protein
MILYINKFGQFESFVGPTEEEGRFAAVSICLLALEKRNPKVQHS